MKSSALLTLGLGITATSLNATVLLTIDVSNPAAITFSATAGTSDATTSVNAVSGFTLMNFFTTSGNVDFSPIGGSLAVGGVVSNYAANDGPPPFGNGANLNFSTTGDPGNPSYSFITGVEAFTGSVTINMTGMDLPADGATGAIFSGRQMNSSLGAQIGTWQVVNAGSPIPEPASAAALVGLAAIGAAVSRRRKREV